MRNPTISRTAQGVGGHRPHRGSLGIRAQTASRAPRHQAGEPHVRPEHRCAEDHRFWHRALTGAGSTRTGIVLGTPSFMSPEQLEGRTVTGHSDLFSLGVSLFQLLTGQLPFTADSMTGLMQQIAEAPHPPLRAFRPDLPACVESVIDRALAKNPMRGTTRAPRWRQPWKTAGHEYRVDCHDWTILKSDDSP
jgi:serine/threonine protein kinase